MPNIYNLLQPINITCMNKPIFVDTNAIVDLYYPNNALVPNINISRLQPYHDFIRDIFNANQKIIITSHVLMEMENVFVRRDYKIYNSQHSPTNISFKDFRSLPSEMARRKVTCSQAFNQIFNNSLIECIDITIATSKVKSFLGSLDTQTLDPNDYLLAVECGLANGILLTDDRDFATTAVGCDLITINSQLLANAQSLGFTAAN